MLQATVEFCKQNVEGTTIVAMFAKQTCKFVLQNTNYVDLRCSPFAQNNKFYRLSVGAIHESTVSLGENSFLFGRPQVSPTVM